MAITLKCAKCIIEVSIGKGYAACLDGHNCPDCGGPLESINAEKTLLRIELDEIGKVPRVYYKGQEVKHKTRVRFEWETRKNKGLFALRSL